MTGFTAADVVLGGTAPGTLVAAVTAAGCDPLRRDGQRHDGQRHRDGDDPGGRGRDPAGNPNRASTRRIGRSRTDDTYDVTTVTINQAAGQADPTRTQPVHFTVVFSRPVTDFTAEDVLAGRNRAGHAGRRWSRRWMPPPTMWRSAA